MVGGLPIAIKELVDVAGVRTTFGSVIFKDHVPGTIGLSRLLPIDPKPGMVPPA